jgi:hypothetical protein
LLLKQLAVSILLLVLVVFVLNLSLQLIDFILDIPKFIGSQLQLSLGLQ